MINTQPKICNICGGKVIYTSNAAVYHGRQYGSGYCYLCLNCGAYARPKEALRLLADASMRKGLPARWTCLSRTAALDIFTSISSERLT